MSARKTSLVLLLLIVALFASPLQGAQTVSREQFISQLFQARGFTPPGGEDNLARAAMDLDVVPLPEGPLEGPVTIKEAIVWSVHSLGLQAMAEALVAAPLPFKDASALKPLERGYIAAALHMNPPLLKKGVSALGPSKSASPEEVKNILAIVRAAQKNFSLSASFSPIKGMTIKVHREGVYGRPPKWRAVANGFDSREDAEAFREALAEKGVEGTVDSQNYDWRVRSVFTDTYGPIREFLQGCEELGRKGFVFSLPSNWDAPGSPRSWMMVVLDPARFVIRPVFPAEGINTLAPLGTMISGAAAAVNGGYFTVASKERGAPIGVIIDGGLMVNPPYKGRTILGWNDGNQAAFGQMEWKGEARFQGLGYMDITGINRRVKSDGVVLFTRHFGPATPDFSGSVVELVLRGDLCTEVRWEGGNPIGDGERILAVYGNASRHVASLKPGARVEIAETINSDDPHWSAMTNAVQAGPFLVRKGQVTMDDENLSDSIVNKKHPRSVIGLTGKGEWFFFVGDGRHGVHSVGFTLAETAEILKKNGVSYALNLDGGGSSTLYGAGRLLNVLSDGRERPVSYGIGAFPRGGE